MFYLADSSAETFQGHNLEYMLRIREFFPSLPTILVNVACSLDVPAAIPAFRMKSWDFGRFGFSSSLFRRLQRFNPELPETAKDKIQRLVFSMSKRKSVIGQHRLGSNQSIMFYKDLVSLEINFKLSDVLTFTSINIRELVGLLFYLEARVSENHEIPKVNVILRAPIIEKIGLFDFIFTLKNSLQSSKILKSAETKVTFYTDTLQLKDYYSQILTSPPTYLPVPGLSEKFRLARKDSLFLLPANSRPDTRHSLENLDWLQEFDSLDFMPTDLNSLAYAQLIAKSRHLVLPYVPLNYRFRSSGIFAEALSVDSKPIVPTGTWMSQEISFIRSDSSGSHLESLIVNGRNNQLQVRPHSPVLIRLKSSEARPKVRIKIGQVTTTHFFSKERSVDEFIYFADGSGKINLNISPESGPLCIEVDQDFFHNLGYCYFPGELQKLILHLEKQSFGATHNERETPQRFSPESTAFLLAKSSHDS